MAAQQPVPDFRTLSRLEKFFNAELSSLRRFEKLQSWLSTPAFSVFLVAFSVFFVALLWPTHSNIWFAFCPPGSDPPFKKEFFRAQYSTVYQVLLDCLNQLDGELRESMSRIQHQKPFSCNLVQFDLFEFAEKVVHIDNVLEVLGVLSQMMEEIRDQLSKRWQSRSLCMTFAD